MEQGAGSGERGAGSGQRYVEGEAALTPLPGLMKTQELGRDRLTRQDKLCCAKRIEPGGFPANSRW